MKKAPVIITSVVVILSMLFVFTFMSTDSEDWNNMLSSHRSTQSLANTTSVTTTVRAIEEKKKQQTNLGQTNSGGSAADDPTVPGVTGPVNQDWLSVVAACKEVLATQVGYYSQDMAGVTVTDWNGNQVQMRPDCSGYVRFCLHEYGLCPDSMAGFSSRTGESGGTWPGTTNVSPSSLNDWSEMIPGDILFYSGHVEVLAESIPAGTSSDYKPQVYNCGWHTSAANPGITTGGHELYKITNIWRVN